MPVDFLTAEQERRYERYSFTLADPIWQGAFRPLRVWKEEAEVK
jgi:hypothetical protein